MLYIRMHLSSNKCSPTGYHKASDFFFISNGKNVSWECICAGIIWAICFITFYNGKYSLSLYHMERNFKALSYCLNISKCNKIHFYSNNETIQICILWTRKVIQPQIETTKKNEINNISHVTKAVSWIKKKMENWMESVWIFQNNQEKGNCLLLLWIYSPYSSAWTLIEKIISTVYLIRNASLKCIQECWWFYLQAWVQKVTGIKYHCSL